MKKKIKKGIGYTILGTFGLMLVVSMVMAFSERPVLISAMVIITILGGALKLIED